MPPIVQGLNVENHPSPNHDSRRGSKVKVIVLHATGGKNSLGHLLDPAPGGVPERAVSSHDLISKNGTIHHLVSYDRRAWHSGVASVPGLPGDVNSMAIGIDLENLNDGVDPYPPAQLDAAVSLVRQLASFYGIPRQYVVTHSAIAQPPGRKSDPRPPAFQIDSFLDRVFGGGGDGFMRFSVISSGVRVRQGPGTGFPIVEVLKTGKLLLVDKVIEGESVDGELRWAHIADGRGFVTMKFLVQR